MERTLAIIKPDAVRAKRTGAILEAIEATGLRPIALRMLQLSREQADATSPVVMPGCSGPIPWICALANLVT